MGRAKSYSTSTRTSDDRLVPWLAAEGPLAYTPEAPPERDSLFQYGWVLPQVCQLGLRRHLYFGAYPRDDAQDLFAFWENARRGKAERVAVREGRLADGTVEAPIAVYRHNTRPSENHYLIIQHGSYQCIPLEEQPDLETGYVLLHRGIGEAKVFQFPVRHRAGSHQKLGTEWEKYIKPNSRSFLAPTSPSTRSTTEPNARRPSTFTIAPGSPTNSRASGAGHRTRAVDADPVAGGAVATCPGSSAEVGSAPRVRRPSPRGTCSRRRL